MTAGYSGTPLAKKLGIGEGDRVGTFGAPDHLGELLDLPGGSALVKSPRSPCDVLMVFAADEARLAARTEAALRLLPADGGLWVAWPKKSSRLETTLSFDVVQPHGLGLGLVDNKVCAIDDDWSGLRFVVRVGDRAAWPVPARSRRR